MKNTFWVALYSFLCGVSLGVYTILKTPFNLLGSLMAIFIAIFFFRKFPLLWMRVLFVIFTILYFLLFIILLTMAQYVQTHPLPA